MVEATTTFGVPSFANISEGDTFAFTVNGTTRFDIGEPPSPFTIDEIRVKKHPEMELTDCPYITFPHQLIPNTTTLEYQYHTTGGTSADIPFNLNTDSQTAPANLTFSRNLNGQF
jgi:hypothetical protein